MLNREGYSSVLLNPLGRNESCEYAKILHRLELSAPSMRQQVSHLSAQQYRQPGAKTPKWTYFSAAPSDINHTFSWILITYPYPYHS